MPRTVLNPAGLYNPVPFGYSHTARVPAPAEWVFVSGQYGSTPEGALASPDFAEQVRQSFENLGIALDAHGLGFEHVVQLRTYVLNPDRERLALVGRTVVEACGTPPPAQTLIGVASLAMPGILFEVDAVAVRP